MTPRDPAQEKAEKIYNRLVNSSDMASLRTGGIYVIAAALREARAEGFNEALEKAARIVEDFYEWSETNNIKTAANKIRALRKES